MILYVLIESLLSTYCITLFHFQTDIDHALPEICAYGVGGSAAMDAATDFRRSQTAHIMRTTRITMHRTMIIHEMIFVTRPNVHRRVAVSLMAFLLTTVLPIVYSSMATRQ